MLKFYSSLTVSAVRMLPCLTIFCSSKVPSDRYHPSVVVAHVYIIWSNWMVTFGGTVIFARMTLHDSTEGDIWIRILDYV